MKCRAWDGITDILSLHYLNILTFYMMLTVSSNVNIHWQRLSVQLWAHWNPPSPWYEGRPHHRENFPTLSNSRLVWILLRLLWFDQWRKHKGDRADGLKSPPNDANIWRETRFSVSTAMHDPKQFFKRPWFFGLRNPRPTARQMSARPTELTRRHLIQCSCIQYFKDRLPAWRVTHM